MTANSKIEWTDSTFNPWIGCEAISPGCEHCYAAAYAKRVGRNFAQRTRTSAAYWRQPLKWNARAGEFGECTECGWRGTADFVCSNCGVATLKPARRRVFCASLADVFDNDVDPAWRDDLLGLIWNTPELDWLLLTKRIGNVQRMLDQLGNVKPGERMLLPRNVWLGATVVNQEEADRDITKLLAVPARVRFLSMEPLLGPVDLTRVQHLKAINWVIAGGESGPNARPMHPDWARSLRDQCRAASVAFFMKQMGGTRDKRGALTDLPDDLRRREFPHAA